MTKVYRMRDLLTGPWDYIGLGLILLASVVGTFTLAVYAFAKANYDQDSASATAPWAQVLLAVLVGIGLAVANIRWVLRTRANRLRSAEIQDRVRHAEDDLSQAIASAHRAANQEQRRLDEALLLSRVWQSVTARLAQYHDDAQSQGRRAFNAAMTAMWVGFLVTVGCGAAAVFLATTSTGTVVVGALGAVSAGLSGYVARTHLRAYEAVSGQLQGYFSQPVEASRYLSAERAIHVSGLSDEARRDLMKSLVNAMVAPPQREGGTTT